MPELSWNQFYKRMKAKGKDDKAIARLWPDYQAGKLGSNGEPTVFPGLEKGNRSAPSLQIGGSVPSKDKPLFNTGAAGNAQNRGKTGGIDGHASREAPTAKNTNTPYQGQYSGASGQKQYNQTNPNRDAFYDDADRGASRPVGFGQSAKEMSPASAFNNLDLSSLLQSMQQSQSMGTPSFGYQDFTDQANSVAAKNFAPQYQALDLAKQNVQGQYDKADPLVAGLYAKLSSDIRNQAQQTGASYDAQVADRGQAGQSQQQDIANTYASTQNNQADLLAKLGLQDAAPSTLQQGTNDSAWQQGLAGQATAGTQDFLNASKNSSVDFQNNVANAEQTQGAVAREGLISQLSQAMSQINQDRLGVASNQSQAASQLGLTLSDRAYTAQQDTYNAAQKAQQQAMDMALQSYGLASDAENRQYTRAFDADNRDYSRAQDSANYSLEMQKILAASGQAQAEANQGLDFKSQGPMAQAAVRMQQYGARGGKALELAQAVAAGNTAQTRGEFINKVVMAGRGQGMTSPADQTVLLEAANQLAETMGYATTKADPLAGIG